MNVYIKGFEVDLDVFKAITARRAGNAKTANDVLRETFGLDRPSLRSGSTTPPKPTQHLPRREFLCKGVAFPDGTEFRAKYKRQWHFGRVEDGHLMVNGKRYGSPSGAAFGLTGTSVNGWEFWECRCPGTTAWVAIDSLRANSSHHRS